MISIRAAVIADVPLLKRLINELAEYEQEPDAVLLTEENLIQDGFGLEPKFRAIIAEEDGRPAGYALFFGFYSTWTRLGIYLEDLFVRPMFRGHGIGKGLLGQVALVARQEGCHTIHLDVLDSNETAIKFYQSRGGTYLEQWRNVLIGEKVLGRLALEIETRR